MMSKLAFKFFIIFITLLSIVHGDVENLGGDDIDMNELKQETLFVSLGSVCVPASLIRSCGHRKAAFPLDWNICMDGEMLIEMLRDGFLNFLKDEYLIPFGPAALLNTYYHLEFVHDGTWEGYDYLIYMPLLKSKYKRRIKRFKNLKNHQGKVYFMRSAYIYSMIDRERCYHYPENIEITDDYSLRLYETLKEVFPTLNFSLIIINNHEFDDVKVEKRINDNLMIIRAPVVIESELEPTYAPFINELLQKKE